MGGVICRLDCSALFGYRLGVVLTPPKRLFDAVGRKAPLFGRDRIT
jgi:hypothetical protein